MEGKVRNSICVIGIMLFVVAFLSFVFTPLSTDIKVFMASANQANYISKNLIIGSYRVWELKGTFSRVLMYAIYKIAILFVDFGTYSFEVCSKFIYAIFIIVICWGSISNILNLTKLKKVILTMLVSFMFFAMHTSCHMQVEMTCSLLLLMSFSLYVNAIKTGRNVFLKSFLAGMLIGSLFFFKSVLILLSVSVVAAIAIWDIKEEIHFSVKRLLIVVLGSVCILIINIGLILLINPLEIQDMLDASAFQSTLFSTTVSFSEILARFMEAFVYKSRFIPIFLIGIIAFFMNLIINISKKKWNLVFLHSIMWLMPFLFIILSNRYYSYHFVTFIFPSLIEIFWLIQEKSNFAETIVAISAIGSLIIYMGYMSIFSNNVRLYLKYDLDSYKENEVFLKKISFDMDEEVLYLDNGLGAYYLGNHSYMKYFFPLPLQRLSSDSELECYKKSLDQVMEYEGKYISVYEKWFFDGNNEAIKEKINSEYRYVGRYMRFSPPQSLASRDITMQYFDLYQKKDY